MSTNWKSIVASNNAKTYVLPDGWDTREKVAEQLECSIDRVRVLMAPAIKTGSVETKVFPVWDKVTERVVRVTAYRKTEPKQPKK